MERAMAVVELIKSVRLQYSTEFLLHGQLYELFDSLNIPFEKEYRLSSEDIVDIFLDGIAIECKVQGQPIRIHRQLERYALHDQVKAIILVTGKYMKVKSKINGKPAYIIHLGAAWS